MGTLLRYLDGNFCKVPIGVAQDVLEDLSLCLCHILGRLGTLSMACGRDWIDLQLGWLLLD